MFRQLIQLIFACLVGAIVLISCTSKPQQKEQEPINVRIGIMPSIDHLPLAVAQALSINDSLGIKVEFVRFFSPMERDIALQTGQIDAAVTDYTSAMIQQAGGIELSVPLALEGQFHLIVRPELSGLSIEELVGKRFALSSNTVIDYITDQVMGTHSIERIEVQKLPIRLEMLAKGEIDAAILPQPFAQLAIAKGMKKIELSTEHTQHLDITGLAVTRSWANQYPEGIEAIKAAYNLAIQAISTLPGDQLETIIATELQLPPAQASQIVLPIYKPASAPSATTLEVVGGWLKQRSLVSADYTPSSLGL